MEERRSRTRTLAGVTSRRQLLRGAAFGAAGALVVALAGCARSAAHSFAIEMQAHNSFSPGTLTIPKGSIVVWQNQDIVAHTTTCDPQAVPQGWTVVLPQGAPAWNSGDVLPGQTWEHTFDTPGRYVYVSLRDPENAMTATITVTG